MSYWERVQQEDLSSAGQVQQAETWMRRRLAVEQYRPRPPQWLCSLALESGFVRASPVALACAHTLVHDPRGVGPTQIGQIFSMAPWLEKTVLRSQDDTQHEARRFALLLDAGVRVFLPAIYEAEGAAAEAAVLRQLPAVHTVRAALIATKLVVGFLEGELRNVSQRSPNAHHLFVTVLRASAQSCIHFDQVVKAARLRKLIPPVVLVEMVRNALVPFTIARRSPATETLDDYAVALLGLMVQLDSTILADLHTPSP